MSNDLANSTCPYHQILKELQDTVERRRNYVSMGTVEELKATLQENLAELQEYQSQLDAIQFQKVNLFPIGSEGRKIMEKINGLKEESKTCICDLMNLAIQRRILIIKQLNTQIKAQQFLAKAEENLQQFQTKSGTKCTCPKLD